MAGNAQHNYTPKISKFSGDKDATVETYDSLVSRVVSAVTTLRQKQGERAEMYMQRVETAIRDFDKIICIDTTLFPHPEHRRAFKHYQERLAAIFFYCGLNADIRREVANCGITDHALVLQKAVWMEEAAASAQEQQQ
jgi:hypothetical protein